MMAPGHGLAGRRPAETGVVHLIQGEHRVSEEPDAVLCTILGSCVAACIRDPVAGVGGMNHFLLPGDPGCAKGADAERYGVHAMELLVNDLLKRGAQRKNLEVKLFGGARTMAGLNDIGAKNAAFSLSFVERERLTLAGQCLGGDRGRRLHYAPVSGRAQRIFLARSDVMPPPPVRPAAVRSGSLELF